MAISGNKKLSLAAIFLCTVAQCQAAKMWSILICTLEERTHLFEPLLTKLCTQIERAHLHDMVEVLYFKDNRTYSVGYKRNALLHASTAEYVSYIDDDDDVHEQYVPMIYEKLLKKPDCVQLVGVMTTRGMNPQLFIHTIRNNAYFWANGAYQRPPNHLNPIKRSIAVQFAFPEKNVFEDTDWAMQLCRAGLLKIEEPMYVPYYFYNYDGKYE